MKKIKATLQKALKRKLLRWVKGVEGISVFDQFGQNFVNLGSIYNRRPNKFLQLENKIFPKDDELQKIYQKICKCGYLSLNLLNELKTYIYDKGRIVKEVPDIVGLYDREGITAYLLRAGNGKYAHSAYSIRPTDRERYSRWEFQHKLLSDYARLENIWYTSKESFIKDFKLTLSDKKGTETDVYLEPSGHYVFKFLKILTENCLYDLLAERILIHNLVFGDKTALRIEGFILEGDNITFAISQPFVKDAKYTTDAELEKFINSPSFSNYHKVSNTCVANSDLVISDLHKQNVLIDKKGQYFVIDCFAKFYRTDDINNDDLNYKPELFKSKDFKIRLGSIVSEPTKQTFYENLYNQLESIVKDDSEYRTIPQITIDRYADILAQKEDWQNFYHWYFFIQKPLKFKDGTFKEGFIETSFDTYLKKNEIGSSQVRLFVKRVTNLFNFICDKCCIRYHTYRVRYEDHGIFKYLNSNRKGTGGTMKLCFDYSENAIFKKAVTMFLALLNANMDDGGNDGVVLYNYKAFKVAEYCTFEKSNQEMPSNTTFKIGSLIRYKDSDGTIYKIVDTTDKGYVVLDLSMPEPFRQRNVIPFANNNQLVEFPILFYNEIEYAKVVSKQHLNGICGIPYTDKYLACLAEHEDWHRCIVDDYTFIDKPNKSKKVSHGYIQRQAKAENKADGERFCEETEQLFSNIISLFPGWATPDPIIRYTPKQGLYYRQLRFTYDENDKFLQVIPEFLAMINADMSKFEFVFDKYSAAKSKCCKFEYTKTTTEIPLPKQEQKRISPFKFDYDSHISAFIKTLDSPQAKKTQPYKIKKDFDKFYQDIFHYTDDLDDIRWIAENNYGWNFVEDNIMGGLTREIYDYLLQDPKTGDYSYNRLQLAKIYYQRLCAECGVTPSATFFEVFYPLFTNEIEYSKIKAKK